MMWRAQHYKFVQVKLYDLRSFSKDKHKKVDHRPYGGGPGMVMTAQPVLSCVDKIKRDIAKRKSAAQIKIIMFAPGAKQFTQTTAEGLVKKYTDIILIAGHYEGIDARVKKILKAEEMTIGPYVLTGGELPAMVIVDCVSRFVPGVLGNEHSREELRVSSSETYTRPPQFEHEGKIYKVPKVLQEGNHAKIDAWRKKRRQGGATGEK